MRNVIKLIDVNKTYGTRVKSQILHDINLEIEEHSINSVVGASGSGKTTLLNIMGTLDRTTSGEVIIVLGLFFNFIFYYKSSMFLTMFSCLVKYKETTDLR